MNIKVPEGMLGAAKRGIKYVSHDGGNSTLCDGQLEQALLFVCRWLAENPIVPTKEQARSVFLKQHTSDPNLPDDLTTEIKINAMVEWQRRMFLAPDPDEPIKDLLKPLSDGCSWAGRIREAFRRGKEAK